MTSLHSSARAAQRRAERAAHGSASQYRDAMAEAVSVMRRCGCGRCRRELPEWGHPVEERCFDCDRVVAAAGSFTSAGVVTEQDGAIRCRPCAAPYAR